MSALGQKQTWPSGPMNAPFTSESDIRGYGSNVCFGPEADICAAKSDVRFTPESGHWAQRIRVGNTGTIASPSTHTAHHQHTTPFSMFGATQPFSTSNSRPPRMALTIY